MRSNELRIGNWVESYLPPQISEWIEVEVSLHTLIKMRDHEMKHGCRPIPLTEDWAKLKFDFINTKGWKGNGFDYQPDTSKTKQSKYRIGNEIELVFERWSYRKTENDDWIHEDSIHIDYFGDCISLYKYEVHVLQNLYFALTGKELTIKE